MANLVIVAIPAEDDYVWKISSEKVPHMTLLFLGDVSKVQNFSTIAGYVNHAADTSLNRFGMDVDHRGVLGQDEADVLFFSKTKWSGYEDVANFRSFLLKESNIKAAFDSTDQHEEWVPHLTLGYPATPAKPDTRDYPGIDYVSFDRIALWFMDFSGLEFQLKRSDYESDMAMATTGMTRSERIVKSILSHHGVKGMRWGLTTRGLSSHQKTATKNYAKNLVKNVAVSEASKGGGKVAETLISRGEKHLPLSSKELSPGKAYAREVASNVAKEAVKSLARQTATTGAKFILKHILA
jgi:2'-5' RNA ligase